MTDREKELAVNAIDLAVNNLALAILKSSEGEFKKEGRKVIEEYNNLSKSLTDESK